MDILKEKQFMITSERWQFLEKERLEVLRKRELIEHRIDLRYHSEEGLEQHRSDYYKRLLKKVEENMEKSKLRNKHLVKRADELLSSVSMSNSNNLVKSKVKLEVAKDRVKEYEELGRQEKLKQIRKTEEEIEVERKKLRESTLEWEREKKVNYDLQEKIKELIVTKEISKKEAIEREAERKAILEGDRKIQRVVEQTSIDASKRYLEKEEKRKLESIDGKDIKYKGLVEEVYHGKIGIAAREKFISPDLVESSQLHKPVDELYYNDGYSSIEEKNNANSFAKFKEWQKKQTVEKKKPETFQKQQPIPQIHSPTIPKPHPSKHDNTIMVNNPQQESKNNDSKEETVDRKPVMAKDILGDSIGSIEDRESESDDITKSFLESIKKPSIVSSLGKKDEKIPIAKPVSPKKTSTTYSEEQPQNTFVKIQSPKSISGSPQHREIPSFNNPVQTIPKNTAESSAPQNRYVSPPKTQKIATATDENKKENQVKKEPEKEQEDHKEGDSKTKKLKSFFSAAFKFTGKKKEDEKPEETESSSENDSNFQDKEGDSMVQQKVKKLNESKLVSTLEVYMQDLENHLKEQKEKYNKMSLNYKLENKENQESLMYSACPKISGKIRLQNIESLKRDAEPGIKCVACLDIIQYLPSPLITTGMVDEGDLVEYELEELSRYLTSSAVNVWKLIILHVSNLSKLEPKWKESLLKVFSDSICKTLPPSKNTTEAKNKTKTLLKNLITTRKPNLVTEPIVQEQPKKNSMDKPEVKEVPKKSILDDSEEENIFDKPLTQVTRPLSSNPGNNKFKKSTRLITSVSAFNPTSFAKLNKNILNEDTSDSDIDNIIARPRNISSAPAERTNKPVTSIPGTSGTTNTKDFDDDDLDF